MAIAFRSFTSGTASGNNPTLSQPAGAASGDLLIAHISNYTDAITGPAGWTKQLDFIYNGNRRSTVWTIIRGGSAPALQWTATDTTGFTWEMAAYTGVHQTTPADVAGASSDNAASTTPTSPSVTTVTADTMLLCGINDFGVDTTVPVGMTTRGGSAASEHHLAELAVAATGATGTKQWTLGASTTSGSWSLALRPGATEALPPRGAASLQAVMRASNR